VRRIEHPAVAQQRRLCWRGLVVYVAAAALVITLANRVLHHSVPETTITAQSHSPKARIQHRNVDACRWAAPVARLLPLPVPAPAHGVGLEDMALRAAPVTVGLYDRPPPLS
jgi:hypothetical protein